MTNKLALYLGLIILALIVFDIVVKDGSSIIFLARKLDQFIEYLAFWR